MFPAGAASAAGAASDRRRSASKLVLLHTLIDNDGQVASDCVHHRHQALRRKAVIRKSSFE